MDLGQYLENLRCDIACGGVEDDSFAAICYITAANEAHRTLSGDVSDEQALDDARQYLALCGDSGCDGLMAVATGEMH